MVKRIFFTGKEMKITTHTHSLSWSFSDPAWLDITLERSLYNLHLPFSYKPLEMEFRWNETVFSLCTMHCLHWPFQAHRNIHLWDVSHAGSALFPKRKLSRCLPKTDIETVVWIDIGRSCGISSYMQKMDYLKKKTKNYLIVLRPINIKLGSDTFRHSQVCKMFLIFSGYLYYKPRTRHAFERENILRWFYMTL